MLPKNSEPKSEKPTEFSPYCAFRNDRQRLFALISRDVRIVLVAVVLLAACITVPSIPTGVSNLWATLVKALIR